jgi:hypothetical protein
VINQRRALVGTRLALRGHELPSDRFLEQVGRSRSRQPDRGSTHRP